MKKPKAIYHAVFETQKTRHDRMMLVNENHSLTSFWDWIQEQRNIIEKKTKKPAIVLFSNLVK